MDERQAIARLKHGDLAGLETLVRLYQAQALHAAYLILGERLAAEDVVQNAFLHAAEKIGQYDERRPFRSWFLRSVVNAALKAAHRQRRLTPLEAGPESGLPSLEDWLPDPGPQPEQIVEIRETRQAVWQALQRLSPEQRAAVIARYYLELSEQETAGLLQRPLSTIKWRLHSARQRLRQLLAPAGLAAPSSYDEPPQE